MVLIFKNNINAGVYYWAKCQNFGVQICVLTDDLPNFL